MKLQSHACVLVLTCGFAQANATSTASPSAASARPTSTVSIANSATTPTSTEHAAAVKAPAATTNTTPAAPAPATATSVETKPAIDLTNLEERLVETDAIGFFTKRELKSQLDDLTGQFREFHQARGHTELPRLREDFDLLLLKLLTLLQDDDPVLHRQVAAARPQIWRTFSDPVLFAQL